MTLADLGTDVCQINTYVSKYEHLVDTLGGPEDTPEILEKLNQTQSHILRLLIPTTAKLQQAYYTKQHSNVNASKRISIAKKHLQAAWTARKESLKTQLDIFSKDLEAAENKILNAQLLANKKIASIDPQAVLPFRYTARDLDRSSDKNLDEPADPVEFTRNDGLPLDLDIELARMVLADENGHRFTTCCRCTWVTVLEKFIPGVSVRCC